MRARKSRHHWPGGGSVRRHQHRRHPLFFAQGAGHRSSTRSIAIGQYLGFAAVLSVAVAAAFGASFLPEKAISYLGLLPLAVGIKAAVQAWRHPNDPE
ncbi:cadmium resistance transporter [Streptomyces sp. NPDC048309]|uniref:cadmium resistance transporter n=1 Tax=Streptomyces sp. NPDC048309 TaxID=3154618 RepID=UPI003408309A